jgi:hypothetical protein
VDVGFVIGQDALAEMLLMKAPLVFRGAISSGCSRRDGECRTYSAAAEFIDAVGVFPGPDQFLRTGTSGN